MVGRVLRPDPLSQAPLPHARIAATRPASLHGDYLFELIVVDGPAAGRCLAQLNVENKKATRGTRTYLPTTPETVKARQHLRAIGEESGYRVTDF